MKQSHPKNGAMRSGWRKGLLRRSPSVTLFVLHVTHRTRDYYPRRLTAQPVTNTNKRNCWRTSTQNWRRKSASTTKDWWIPGRSGTHLQHSDTNGLVIRNWAAPRVIRCARWLRLMFSRKRSKYFRVAAMAPDATLHPPRMMVVFWILKSIREKRMWNFNALSVISPMENLQFRNRIYRRSPASPRNSARQKWSQHTIKKRVVWNCRRFRYGVGFSLRF